MKKEKGIALTTLIVMIVVLIILVVAGVFFITGYSKDGGTEENKNQISNKKNSLDDLETTKDIEEALSQLNWFYNVDGNNDVWRVRINTFKNNLKGYSRSYIDFWSDDSGKIQTMSFDYLLNENKESFQIGLYNIDEVNKQKQLEDYKRVFSDFVLEEEVYNGYKIVSHNKSAKIEVYKFLERDYAFCITLNKKNFEEGLEKYKQYILNLIDNISVQKYSILDFDNNTAYLEKYFEKEERALYLSSKKIDIEDKFEIDLTNYSIIAFNEKGYTWIKEEDIKFSVIAWCNRKDTYMDIWLLNKNSESLNALLAQEGEINNVNIKGIEFIELNQKYTSFYVYESQNGVYVIRVEDQKDLEDIMQAR
jgi:hypothetical protein